MSRPYTLKLLNKLTVTELAQLSNFSKSYISQVKHGKCPPSEKLVKALFESGSQNKKHPPDCYDALGMFLKSRREGISPNTLRGYRITLSKALHVLGLAPTTKAINLFLSSLPCTLGGKYGYFKCIRAFYNWLYSPRSGFDLEAKSNPVTWVDAPKRPQLILPSLSSEQVMNLIGICPNLRDKAIIALFTESGLRLSELTNIKPSDIDWQKSRYTGSGQG